MTLSLELGIGRVERKPGEHTRGECVNSSCGFEELVPLRTKVPAATIPIESCGAPDEETMFPRPSVVTCLLDEHSVCAPGFPGLEE